MLSLLKSFYCLRNTSVMNHRSLFFFFKSVPEQGSGSFLNEKKKSAYSAYASCPLWVLVLCFWSQ